MTEHEKLIGKHPINGAFKTWLSSEDMLSSSEKIHRKLVESESERDNIIDELASWLIKHHISEKTIKRIEKKKAILDKYGFTKYLSEDIQLFPQRDVTQKGNCGEVILSEYLQACSSTECLVYKFHYNTNIEEAMKGDDVLLFNKENLEKKVILGESKFRAKSSKPVVDEVSKGFRDKITLPLSMEFIIRRVEDAGDFELVEKLEDLNHKMILGQIPIINVGFILSDSETFNRVEKHMVSVNPNFIIISFNSDNPAELVENAFKKAIEKVEDI